MTRSVRIREFGGPDVLRIVDVAIQEPKAGEVRLRVRYRRSGATTISLQR